MKSTQYHINRSGERDMIQGYRTIIPDYEQFHFFAHRYGAFWRVSEAITGLAISSDEISTRKKAIERAIERLKFYGIEKTVSVISMAIDKELATRPLETCLRLAKFGDPRKGAEE